MLPPVETSREFRVRPLERRDAPRVAALFSEVFGRAMGEEEVRWKLLDTPAQLGVPSSFVAEADGRVVGQYAGTPMRFLVHGRERPGLHGCDVMTAAGFRRRGVLTALGTRAHEAWRRAGLVFVTGLANNAWGTRAAALSWEELFPIRWLAVPLRPEAALARRLGVRARVRFSVLGPAWRRAAGLRWSRDASVRVDELEAAGDDLDDLWTAVRGELGFSVVRDRAWVDWRYLSAPGARYRVTVARRRGRTVGYLAWTERSGGRAIIAEVFTAPSDEGARGRLLGAACDGLHASGAEVAHVLAVPGSPLWESCRRGGLLARGQYAFELVRLDGAVGRADVADPRRWTLQGGDFDVV
jgi:predicted N-acetyltransferase YhbS